MTKEERQQKLEEKFCAMREFDLNFRFGMGEIGGIDEAGGSRMCSSRRRL